MHADFSGELNTSTSVDGISENQLAQVINLEVDHATGKLKRGDGTIDLLQFQNIFAAMYDEINRRLLLVDADKVVWCVNGAGDDTNWKEVANVDSSAKFLEVDHKDGGEYRHSRFD